MIILAIRTDSPITELILIQDSIVLEKVSWESGRALASSILRKINELCESNVLAISSIEAVICYEGPGSFTGLRIGITVGNTIAYSNTVPIVGATGDDWISVGIKQLQSGANAKVLLPQYGAEANITL